MISITISAFTVYFLLPIYKRFLKWAGSVEYNFRHNLIPISLGGLILLVELIFLIIFKENDSLNYWPFLVIITIVGTYDDIYGNKEIKGLRGHIKAFFRGNLTSGFVKAISGVGIAIVLGQIIGESPFYSFTHTLLILFMINMINLFDLRPGRALKVFFLFFIILSFTTLFLQESLWGRIVFGILLIVFYEDLHAKIMIGDSGANLIGLHLGIWYSLYMPIYYQWIIIIFLVYLHYFAEKNSISELISRHQYLKKIDLWGRKGTL